MEVGPTIARKVVDNTSVRGGVGSIDANNAGVWIGLIQRIKGRLAGIYAKCLVVEVRIEGDEFRLNDQLESQWYGNY